MAGSATSLEVVNSVVAALGFALAAASLTWQAITWRLSGGRVKAELLQGAIQRAGIASQRIQPRYMTFGLDTRRGECPCAPAPPLG